MQYIIYQNVCLIRISIDVISETRLIYLTCMVTVSLIQNGFIRHTYKMNVMVVLSLQLDYRQPVDITVECRSVCQFSIDKHSFTTFISHSVNCKQTCKHKEKPTLENVFVDIHWYCHFYDIATLLCTKYCTNYVSIYLQNK